MHTCNYVHQEIALTRQEKNSRMRTFNIRSKRTKSAKVGLSAARRAAATGDGLAWRYLLDGEKSLMTRGHTRSVSSWLNNFSCWDQKF